MMKTLSDKEWEELRIENLFEVSRPAARNKDNYKSGDIPFVASGSVNNGVMKLCAPNKDEALDKGNCITVSPVDGSTFYQPVDFLGRGGAGSSILMLRNEALTLYQGQFIARAIEQTCSKYTYGHMGNKDSIKRERIMLPVADDGEPDYDYMADYVREHKEAMLAKYRDYAEKQIAELGDYVDIPALDEKEWGEFSFSDIFDIQKGFYNKKPEDTGDGNIPFLGATDANNGVTRFLTMDNIQNSTRTGALPNSPLDRKLFKGHAIGVTNNGSVGHAFYQATQFTCSHDINPLYLKDHEMSKAEAMFLIEAIEKQGKLFQYARKWRPIRMVKSKILLPINDSGEPDFDYMEQYAKNMMLRKYKQYLTFLENQEGDELSGEA